jgi:hypothetical protein
VELAWSRALHFLLFQRQGFEYSIACWKMQKTLWMGLLAEA